MDAVEWGFAALISVGVSMVAAPSFYIWLLKLLKKSHGPSPEELGL